MELVESDVLLQNDPSKTNFQKRPLYYWVKSFAEKEIHTEDSFKSFVGSNAVTYALEYIGITTEAEQSSLHLSAIFDEADGPTSFNSSNGSYGTRSNNGNSLSSSTFKFSNHFESETKSKIQLLNKTFNELKSFFEDNFSQLVLIRPPNTVHISCNCTTCSVAEYEKVLILLLGGAIQGLQRQDTIRKIKSYPATIQEALIDAIKLAADNPELLHVKSWAEYSKLQQDEQQKIYERLLALTRKLLLERNELVQNQLLSDYIHGYISCDRKRNLNEWKCEALELEKNSDESRATTTMRQLRDELMEKSELLQECREELEVTKVSLQNLQDELLEAQKQLKSFKKARDELDVLRESQEKTQRLESELQRMKKKLEDSEQYYEKIEILQNENRNFQLKHAILMDQINMLTVDKERLELSFLTQSVHCKSLDEDIEENNMHSSSRRRQFKNMNDEQFLIETEMEELKLQLPSEENDISSSTPAKPSTTTNLLEDITPIVSLTIEDVALVQNEPEPPELKIIEERNETAKPMELTVEQLVDLNPVSPTVKERKPKRFNRKQSGLNVKRTKRALLFSPSSSRNAITSGSSQAKQKCERPTAELVEPKVESDQDIDPQLSVHSKPSKVSKRPQRRRLQQWPPKDNQQRIVPSLEIEGNDADEELSLSPNNVNVVDEEEQNENFEGFINDTKVNELANYEDTAAILENINESLANCQIDDDLISHSSSDNELFFICSSNATTSASSSNLKISNGRNVPIMQITTGSSTMRASDSDAGEDGNSHPCCSTSSQLQQPHCCRNHNDNNYTQDLLTNCNIQLSLHHVNSHDVNIGHNNGPNVPTMFEYPNGVGEGRISSSTAYVNKLPKYKTSTTPPTFNLNRIQMQADESTSSEDDDSVWYEYGCV